MNINGIQVIKNNQLHELESFSEDDRHLAAQEYSRPLQIIKINTTS
jgi:tRNA G37 N-methylase TrmD